MDLNYVFAAVLVVFVAFCMIYDVEYRMSERRKNIMKSMLFMKIMNWMTEERNILKEMYKYETNTDIDRSRIMARISELSQAQTAITSIFREESDK